MNLNQNNNKSSSSSKKKKKEESNQEQKIVLNHNKQMLMPKKSYDILYDVDTGLSCGLHITKQQQQQQHLSADDTFSLGTNQTIGSNVNKIKRRITPGKMRLILPVRITTSVLLISYFWTWIGSNFVMEATMFITTSAEENIAKQKHNNPSSFLCRKNPYADALETSLDNVSSRMDQWLSDDISYMHNKSTDKSMYRYNHERFFPFEEMATCSSSSTSCVGGACGKDTSKIVCGLEYLQKGCIIYSIGGNNQWQFERNLLQRTPCDIHTFDCTGDINRFVKPTSNDRLHFHHVCLGHESSNSSGLTSECGLPPPKKCGDTWTLKEMQSRLNHSRIDLFKIDIEGFEWPLLESWPDLYDEYSNASQVILPMQILVEIHYRTFPEFQELHHKGPKFKRDFKFAPDLVNLQQHLLKMGYIVVKKNNNIFCRHCTELTLVRARCPDTGVYTEI